MCSFVCVVCMCGVKVYVRYVCMSSIVVRVVCVCLAMCVRVWMYVCMFWCMCGCTFCTCISIHVWVHEEPEADAGDHPLSLFTLFTETGSSNQTQSLSIWVVLLASLLWRPLFSTFWGGNCRQTVMSTKHSYGFWGFETRVLMITFLCFHHWTISPAPSIVHFMLHNHCTVNCQLSV